MAEHPLGRRFRRQALACTALGSPLYGALLERAGADLELEGPTAVILAGYENAPRVRRLR